jgi:carbon monoxide dehydrogenase subunit G
MTLENEFTVRAALERTWNTLLDVARVVGCPPGASVAPCERDGTYNGRMPARDTPTSRAGRARPRASRAGVRQR